MGEIMGSGKPTDKGAFESGFARRDLFGLTVSQGALMNMGAFSAITLSFVVRFGLGAVSYAAGTPGGLFAPMLVLGAQTGLVASTPPVAPPAPAAKPKPRRKKPVVVKAANPSS